MNLSVDHPLAGDLEHILKHSADVWPDLVEARIFITGGTGFIGTWMVESLLWANKRRGLGLELTVLTRNSEVFLAKVRHLAGDKHLHFAIGDVRTFMPPKGKFTHVIHAATSASAELNIERPFEMIDTIINGAMKVFEFTAACGAKTVLHTSSGGVYGPQPASLHNLPEEYTGAPNPLDPLSAYSEAKRLAEMMGSISSKKYGYSHKIARITALVGPHLPLGIHYALGNFIGNALRNEPIQIKGDGTPIRSYLYVADLIAWLWIIMVRGANNRPYNAGSEQAVSLFEAAQTVAQVHGGSLKIIVGQAPMLDGRPSRYVPSTERARNELGVGQWTDFCSALQKTFDWHRGLRAR